MQTVKQQCTVEFKAIEVKDAVVLTPLMDMLHEAKTRINERKQNDSKNGYNQNSYFDNFALSETQVGLFFDKLVELGFCTSEGSTTLPEYKPKDAEQQDK